MNLPPDPLKFLVKTVFLKKVRFSQKSTLFWILPVVRFFTALVSGVKFAHFAHFGQFSQFLLGVFRSDSNRKLKNANPILCGPEKNHDFFWNPGPAIAPGNSKNGICNFGSLTFTPVSTLTPGPSTRDSGRWPLTEYTRTFKIQRLESLEVLEGTG